MNIELRNCNNIEQATIELIEDKLNIKYAINGTGKSTIAKAIELKCTASSFQELIPFKYLERKNSPSPEVIGLDNINTVLIFNESYMSQFTFQQDELVSNSFDIFIKSPDYDKHMERIELLLTEIKKAFEQDENLTTIISDLTSFIDSFGKAASGYSAAGALAKGIGNGNKVENIPTDLIGYTDFIKSDKKVPWLGWQFKGYEFMDISQKCPFCTSEATERKELIKKVKDNYDAKAIEHLNNILDVISKLSIYFSNETNERFTEISKKADKLSKEEIEYLLQVKQQAILLRDKLTALKTISFFKLKDVDRVVEIITDQKIDIKFLPYFKSEHTSAIIKALTNSLDQVLEKASQLQGEVNQQKKTIESAITENSTEINTFLLSAGYKYQVFIEFENDEYRMKLRHEDYDKPIKNGNQYLSYGEKNALAIILFMYEAISKNPDLIILDDPISSFDKNKKYAMIDMLFGSRRGLVNKSVILFTHDFEPIIDLMYTLYRKFSNKVVASFIENSGGYISEKKITKNDIKTFTEICNENINAAPIDVIKLIHLRRLYEILDNKGLPYELLSNLFHKRDTPFKKIDNDEIILTSDEINEATIQITEKITSFDYHQLLLKVKNDSLIKDLYVSSTNNYEKLELYRTLTGEAIGDNVLCKYINETFHIENDYVMQLNPLKYQVIPNYIIDQCNKQLGVS